MASGIQHEPNTIEDVLAETSGGVANAGAGSGSTSGEAQPGSPTIFNGIDVPPMKDLTGEAFDVETKDGYWYAKTLDHSSLLFFLATEILEGCG